MIRALALVAVTAACTHAPAARPTPASEPPVAVPVPKERIVACVEQLSRDDLTGCITPDATAELMDGGTVSLAALHATYPDVHVGVETIFIADREVFLLARITGTHAGRTLGLPALVQLALDSEGRTTHARVYLDPGPSPRAPLPPLTVPPTVVLRFHGTIEELDASTVRRFTDAVNAHRAADVLALVTDNLVDSDPGLPEDLSAQAAKDMYQGLLHDIADYHRDVPTLYPIGDHVIAPGIKTGTWSGAKVTLHYAEVIRMDHGKIAEIRRFYNVANMAAQITR